MGRIEHSAAIMWSFILSLGGKRAFNLFTILAGPPPHTACAADANGLGGCLDHVGQKPGGPKDLWQGTGKFGFKGVKEFPMPYKDGVWNNYEPQPFYAAKNLPYTNNG